MTFQKNVQANTARLHPRVSGATRDHPAPDNQLEGYGCRIGLWVLRRDPNGALVRQTAWVPAEPSARGDEMVMTAETIARVAGTAIRVA